MALIIFTSPNHGELTNYWHLHEETDIIKNGKRFHDSVEWDTLGIKAIVDAKEDFVLIHENDSELVRRITEDLEGFNMATYSFQNPNLRGKLWSWKSNYEEFEIPTEEPKLPFDKLCWAIHLSDDEPIRTEKISEAINEVITFFCQQKNSEHTIDKALQLLHLCGTPQGAAKTLGMELISNFDHTAKGMVESLSQMNDSKSVDYKNNLIELRNYIL